MDRGPSKRGRPPNALREDTGPPPPVAAYDRPLREKLQRRYQQLAKRLGHPVERLPTLPDVSCLGEFAAQLTGGRAELIQLAQAAMLTGDAAAKAWWTVYADLTPTERELVNLDEIGLAAGVAWWDLVGVVTATGARLGTSIGRLIHARAQPAVVAAAALSAQALGEAGFPDRQMFFQGAGLVPVPRGHVTEVNVHATAQAAASAESETPGRGMGFLSDVAGAEDARKTVHTQLIEAATPAEPVFEGVTVEREKVPVGDKTGVVDAR